MAVTGRPVQDLPLVNHERRDCGARKTLRPEQAAMSEHSQFNDERDAFWARVRASLVAMRPGRREEREPAYGTAAIARSLGARIGGRIEDALHGAWTRCAAGRVSLCVLAIEVDRFRELHHAYDRETIDADMAEVQRAIRACLPRTSDACLRHGRGGFVVVMADYPVLMAGKLARAIAAAVAGLGIAHKESHAGIVTVSSGLAVINPQGRLDRGVFAAATTALARAQRRGLGQVETVDLRPRQQEKRAG
jgi:diguanylate cyclase (GGDEF)-like protein